MSWFIYGDVRYIINLEKYAKNNDTVVCVVNCIFYKLLLLLSIYLYCTWCM